MRRALAGLTALLLSSGVAAATECAASVKTTCKLKVGQLATGSFYQDGDSDWWAVPLRGGVAYDINAKAEDKRLLDAELAVRLPNGTIKRIGFRTCLDDKCVNRIANFKPAKTATYFVSFTSWGKGTVGPYTLKATIRR